MMDCPRCADMVEAGMLPSCGLCRSTRTVSPEQFLRWKYRNHAHKTLQFDGTEVTVAVSGTFDE
jgi:hypothetical protein